MGRRWKAWWDEKRARSCLDTKGRKEGPFVRNEQRLLTFQGEPSPSFHFLREKEFLRLVIAKWDVVWGILSGRSENVGWIPFSTSGDVFTSSTR